MRFAFRLACVLVLSCVSLTAQVDTAVQASGQVTDVLGAAIQGATVELKNQKTGRSISTTTNDEGMFNFSVPPGEYNLVVTVPGFQKFTRTNIIVSPGQTRAINVSMKLGEVSAAVDVTTGGSQKAAYMPDNPAEITWNVWAESASRSPHFQPLEFLEPGGKNYSLVLDLAAFPYREGSDIYTRTVSEKLRDWLLKSDLPDIELKLVIIPDENYFEPLSPNERVRTMPVNLKSVRKALKDGVKVRDDPFEILKNKPDADFSFGRVSVRLSTRKPPKEGVARVAVAIWADGSMPVDELSIPLCVVNDGRNIGQCEFKETLQDSLAGIDPLRAAAQEHTYAMKPNAALHFVQLDPGNLVGIFRDNSWPADRFVYWKLKHSSTGLIEYLQRTLLPNFDLALNDDSLLEVGTDLYNLLFPQDYADEARAAFADFVRSSRRNNNDPSNPPSIFIRLLSDLSQAPYLIPLGIMVYEVDEQREFLGFNFRVQTPLQVQDYRTEKKCISKWVVLAPSSDVTAAPEELMNAREKFSGWFDKWEFKHLNGIPEFSAWMRKVDTEESPLALFILAHQTANTLYYSEDSRFPVNSIARRFKAPSVAIVNGCGTGAPGASEVVGQLNQRGISTIIATSAEVHPLLAGDYFSVIGEILADGNGGKPFPLGLAHFQTLKKLSMRSPKAGHPPYGAKVLAYQLLGNSSLQICSPPNKSKRD